MVRRRGRRRRRREGKAVLTQNRPLGLEEMGQKANVTGAERMRGGDGLEHAGPLGWAFPRSSCFILRELKSPRGLY